MACVYLASCEKQEDWLLYQTNIQGNSNVKLIRQAQAGDNDDYRLEVYDDKGYLRARMIAVSRITKGTMVRDKDGLEYTVLDNLGNAALISAEKKE